jgi:hypothetical protein
MIKDEMGRACITPEKKHAYEILMIKTQGEWPLLDVGGRIMNLREIGWSGMDSPGTGQGPVEGSCEYGNKPYGSTKCWEIL